MHGWSKSLRQFPSPGSKLASKLIILELKARMKELTNRGSNLPIDKLSSEVECRTTFSLSPEESLLTYNYEVHFRFTDSFVSPPACLNWCSGKELQSLRAVLKESKHKRFSFLTYEGRFYGMWYPENCRLQLNFSHFGI